MTHKLSLNSSQFCTGVIREPLYLCVRYYTRMRSISSINNMSQFSELLELLE